MQSLFRTQLILGGSLQQCFKVGLLSCLIPTIVNAGTLQALSLNVSAVYTIYFLKAVGFLQQFFFFKFPLASTQQTFRCKLISLLQ